MIIMFIGACLLTGAYGPTDQVFLSVFCFSLFFYAVGERLGNLVVLVCQPNVCIQWHSIASSRPNPLQ